jgi:hypothetical protein
MEKCGYIDTGKCRKKPEQFYVKYFCGNALCKGTVTEFSEHCMCINTDMCLPLNAKIELIIPSREEALSVHAQVRRVLLQMTDEISDSMSVEILNPSNKYLNLVDRFRNNR